MGAASSAGDTDLRRAPRVDAAVRGAAAASASGMVAGVCASDARRRVVRACVTAEPGASASGTAILACACIGTMLPAQHSLHCRTSDLTLIRRLQTARSEACFLSRRHRLVQLAPGAGSFRTSKHGTSFLGLLSAARARDVLRPRAGRGAAS